MISMLSSVDDVVPGFDQTVAEIIGEVAGTYEGTFDWDADPFVANAYAGTSSALTAPILYEGGSIEVHESELGGTVEGCSTMLMVDVGLSFETADGAFAEKGSVSLTFDSEAGLVDFNPKLLFSFDTNQGTLAESDFMLDPGESLFGVSLLLDPPANGSIIGSLFVEVDTGMGVSSNTVAWWQVTKQ